MVKFLLKLVVNGAIVISMLMYYSQATFGGAVIAAAGLTVTSYFLGDQLILRRGNNALATFADFVWTALYLGVASFLFDWGLNAMELLFISVLVGAAEWLLHRYVMNMNWKTAL